MGDNRMRYITVSWLLMGLAPIMLATFIFIAIKGSVAIVEPNLGWLYTEIVLMSAVTIIAVENLIYLKRR